MSLSTAIIIIAAIPATLFPIIYGLTAPWWRSLLGRALMTKAAGLAALIDIALLHRAIGDEYAGVNVVRLVVYSLVTLGLWLQFIALLHEQVDRHRKHSPAE